ncbi:MAG: DUF502 domain-containing protein [bacterium]
MGLFGYIRQILRRYFVSGILVIVPLIITYLVLRFLFTSIDGILSPWLEKWLGYYKPGLGILVTLLIILLAGVLTRGLIGGRLVHQWEKLITALPLVRTIYSAAKQLLISVAGPQTGEFNRVVIVPYPRVGVYAIAFSSESVDLSKSGIEGDYVAVFIPSTPTPFTGFVVIVNKEDVHPTDITIEEAIKFLVSGGIAVPTRLLPENLRQQLKI